MIKRQIIVQIWEYERGWGRKLLGEVEFWNMDEALAFIEKENSGNVCDQAPDYYIQAELA